MSLNDWIRCPDGCDAATEAVLLPDGRIGFSCVGCGRKIVSPV